MYGAVTWVLRQTDQKYLRVWCRRRMEKTIWRDRVKNEEVLHGIKEERNVLHKINRKKAKRIGHILCKYCLEKHVIKGETERTRRREGTRQQLLDSLE